MNVIASAWVDLYHAAFVSKRTLDQENEYLSMCAAQKDLDSCYCKLSLCEAQLQERALSLAENAVAYKWAKNMPVAKKKMVERARIMSQLDKIQKSIAMIEMHRLVSTVFYNALSQLMLFTTGPPLKEQPSWRHSRHPATLSSNWVLQWRGFVQLRTLWKTWRATCGTQRTSLTSVLSSDSVTGMVNSIYGGASEDYLLREHNIMDSKEEALVSTSIRNILNTMPSIEEECNDWFPQNTERTMLPA